MSKDVEPITEKLTIYEKLKRYFKQKIYKHKVETVTIDLQNNTLRSIKAVNDDITTLYADGNPYCIINQKGDVIWQSKN